MLLEFIGPSYFTSTIKGNIRWAAAELFEVPEDQDEDEISVSLSTECDIYSFGSITLQVLTCKVPYYNVRKDNVVLGQVMKGKKPEPPKESPIAPPRWEFIQRCWLPRASRPSIGEIVAFVATISSAFLPLCGLDVAPKPRSRLKVNIGDKLHHMVNAAKQNPNDTLKRKPVSTVERERLAKEHLAEEQFRIALEHERKERC
ncbi:hypothetical protein AZE42_10856 [Rhizopogon vesiculosus]|uniref:Protein kinase domain-containing protein n=1 Tax=Rhizopogon vesiculosus TaxID=180088 RepID=A0A1J8QW82_9AGAM|nr:hypothetical protein AZE42_10856 [Rhizopogon vesiculosus]